MSIVPHVNLVSKLQVRPAIQRKAAARVVEKLYDLRRMRRPIRDPHKLVIVHWEERRRTGEVSEGTRSGKENQL